MTSLLLVVAALTAAPGNASPQRGSAALPCGDPLSFQVLLDRNGFSPGEIDAKLGDNATHALAAFQAAHDLEPTGQPDCKTWQALGAPTAEPVTHEYLITA